MKKELKDYDPIHKNFIENIVEKMYSGYTDKAFIEAIYNFPDKSVYEKTHARTLFLLGIDMISGMLITKLKSDMKNEDYIPQVKSLVSFINLFGKITGLNWEVKTDNINEMMVNCLADVLISFTNYIAETEMLKDKHSYEERVYYSEKLCAQFKEDVIDTQKLLMSEDSYKTINQIVKL